MLHASRLVGITLLLLAAPLTASRSDIEGRWLTQDRDGWIRIILVGDSLEGRIAGAPPGSPSERELDDRNPNPALRTRKLDGLAIMTGFEYDGDGRWKIQVDMGQSRAGEMPPDDRERLDTPLTELLDPCGSYRP